MRRWALSAARYLLANSRFTADRFVRANPWAASRVVQVVALGACDDGAQGRDGPGAGYALVVGRLEAGERYKGHDLLLEVWPEVLRARPSAKLHVVGDGTDRGRLEAKAQALGLENAVSFLGRLGEADLLRQYADCAYFVMPSTHEGFGLVYLEAMRASKPCIAGRDAAAEVVEDGTTGLLCDQERESLLSAVLRLEGDPALRDRMGCAGRRRYEGHFTDQHFASRLRVALDLEPRS
jgi:glycosyltransferase involved in cell wall biosynthesis